MIFNRFFAAPLDSPDSIGIPNVEANETTLQSVLSYVFAAAGAISVLMVIIGGVRYIISAGNPQQATSAKNTIIYAIVGLVISISAFIIVNFIFNAIGNDPTAELIHHTAVFR